MRIVPLTFYHCAVLSLLLALSFAVHAASPPTDLDALVEEARKEFNVPGIAVAIVQDGQPVIVKGYGVRTIDEPARVDSETVFNIASLSKGFTAAALAMLVDEGKLDWDDPVIKHLPSFQMFDPWVTREITVRDILSHRSGLGTMAGDLLYWLVSQYSAEEIVFRMRYIKPASSFRSTFAYNNCMYIVAGQVLQAASGKTWDAFIRERVFTPLGMNHSSTSMEALPDIPNKATSHAMVDGKLQTVPYANSLNAAPAGGINSCAEDMARWLAALLRIDATRVSDGKGTNLLSKVQLHHLWAAQTPRPTMADDPPPKMALLKVNFDAYGMGFELADKGGRKIVSHTGSMPGQRSALMIVPDLKLGVAILSNNESDSVVTLMLHIMTRYAGSYSNDWIGSIAAKSRKYENRKTKELEAIAATRVKDSTPSLPLERYAGDYEDVSYGAVNLKVENGKLVLRFKRTPLLISELEHWQHDTFVARWRSRWLNSSELRGDAFVTFALNSNGTINQMKMAKISPDGDESFAFEDLNFKPVSDSR